ncbi:retropepsin-like aspartic protease family protein [Litchfieldella xinjiangensis]|uniref:retropepsin-like aspartic protease family protein n=1 Tax=Litchfieldella xinjiangensis TaxID=1166948 RepID=UPI0005B818D2|nr:TIGR02281 family clan AA aspartic protease [Halomonas xinjiangensis]
MSDEDKGIRRVGLGMMLLFWLLLLAMGSWWFHHYLERRHNPNANLVEQEGAEGGSVTLERNASGHFVATGRINGEPVEFLLDTGATYLAIPADLAERLELAPGRPAMFQTANGRVQGYMTQVDRVSLGGLATHDVPASINPGMDGDMALLGMSFLGRFDIQIRGTEMVLRLPEAP